MNPLTRLALVAVALVGAIVIAIAILGLFVFSNRSFDGCVQTWATSTTQRTEALVNATNARNNALDALIRDVAEPPAQAKIDFPRDLAVYIKASDAYRHQLTTHPVPPPPTLSC